MGWYKRWCCSTTWPEIGYTATGITACGFLTAAQTGNPLRDEIKQDVYFIERQSEFHRNGKFR
jgi:S-adenosylmethionine/arginine decarboxylase-like enzyme